MHIIIALTLREVGCIWDESSVPFSCHPPPTPSCPPLSFGLVIQYMYLPLVTDNMFNFVIIPHYHCNVVVANALK